MSPEQPTVDQIKDATAARERRRRRAQSTRGPWAATGGEVHGRLTDEQVQQLGDRVATARVRCGSCSLVSGEAFDQHEHGVVLRLLNSGHAMLPVDLDADRYGVTDLLWPAHGLCPTHGPLLVSAADLRRKLRAATKRPDRQTWLRGWVEVNIANAVRESVTSDPPLA